LATPDRSSGHAKTGERPLLAIPRYSPMKTSSGVWACRAGSSPIRGAVWFTIVGPDRSQFAAVVFGVKRRAASNRYRTVVIAMSPSGTLPAGGVGAPGRSLASNAMTSRKFAAPDTLR